jgi:flagella basal body P-ring formation protein FlgA
MGVLALTWLIAAGVSLPAAGDAPLENDVRIYMPRDLRVQSEELTVAQVCVVLAGQTDLEKKVKAISLGRAPWVGEDLSIDRNTLLSRLASAGVAKEQVRFTGAEAVVIRRMEKVIGGEVLQAAAEEHLKKTMPGDKDSIYRVLRRPDDVTLSGVADADMVCSLTGAAAAGQVKVTIALSREGRQIAQREAVFQRLYPVRRAVASREIPAGEVLSDENVEVQTTWAASPAGEWKSPLGLLAVRRLGAGTTVRPDMTAERKPDLAIERNQMVRMRVQGEGFTIATTGQAMERGKVGDFIKVRNVDSKRIVTARVAFDGVVEPVVGK